MLVDEVLYAIKTMVSDTSATEMRKWSSDQNLKVIIVHTCQESGSLGQKGQASVVQVHLV